VTVTDTTRHTGQDAFKSLEDYWQRTAGEITATYSAVEPEALKLVEAAFRADEGASGSINLVQGLFGPITSRGYDADMLRRFLSSFQTGLPALAVGYPAEHDDTMFAAPEMESVPTAWLAATARAKGLRAGEPDYPWGED
jgi:hypothetical protein